ncbi:MAG: mechanosensitive ion channel [Candidatus Improbicoccus devescovinae]|nr:MAG: mechanosensitive ion channel [Candidatus Improbicoccus devescovinae]
MQWAVINDFFLNNFKHILWALPILVIGLWIINKSSRSIVFFLDKSVDSGVISFFESIIKISLKFLLFFLILASFNINIFSIITALSASLLTFGLILKDSMSNLAAGFSIILDKPIHVGDKIQIGSITGTVVSIKTTHTLLRDSNDKTIIIPNFKLISEIVYRNSELDIISIKFSYILANFNKKTEIFALIERYVMTEESKILITPHFKIHTECDTENKYHTKFVFQIWIHRKNIENSQKIGMSFLETVFSKNNIQIVKKDTEIIL